jgi:hypothetical protein
VVATGYRNVVECGIVARNQEEQERGLGGLAFRMPCQKKCGQETAVEEIAPAINRTPRK